MGKHTKRAAKHVALHDIDIGWDMFGGYCSFIGGEPVEGTFASAEEAGWAAVLRAAKQPERDRKRTPPRLTDDQVAGRLVRNAKGEFSGASSVPLTGPGSSPHGADAGRSTSLRPRLRPKRRYTPTRGRKQERRGDPKMIEPGKKPITEQKQSEAAGLAALCWRRVPAGSRMKRAGKIGDCSETQTR